MFWHIFSPVKRWSDLTCCFWGTYHEFWVSSGGIWASKRNVKSFSHLNACLSDEERKRESEKSEKQNKKSQEVSSLCVCMYVCTSILYFLLHLHTMGSTKSCVMFPVVCICCVYVGCMQAIHIIHAAMQTGSRNKESFVYTGPGILNEHNS